MVLARGVSRIIPLTVASRQETDDPTRSVAPVTLFLPGVAVVVVAVDLPEAGLVVVEELDSTHPLGALPEVEMRNQKARRPAVLRRERLASELVSDPGLSACR